jgi:hypothetical protein
MTDSKTGIPLAVAQETLEAARNAEDKVVSEYSTPIELAQILAGPLPQFREAICDLTGGRGQFIAGVADGSTTNALIADIQPHQAVKIPNRPAYQAIEWSRITGDITKVYQLLVEAAWEGDLFTLNPPFSLHFHKERLAAFAESKVAAVRQVWDASDPQAGKDAIDSTIAVWAISLDRMTYRGEGVLIANNATLQRLVFDPGAPYSALAEHVWLRIVLDGNPMTKSDKDSWGNDIKTGIVYYAKEHTEGPQMTLTDIPDLQAIEERVKLIPEIRFRLRRGPSVRGSIDLDKSSAKVWEAVRTEWNSRQKEKRTDYNVWLEDGVIKVQLSRYDERVDAVNRVMAPKRDAGTLFALMGQTPMALVTQVNTRSTLLRIAKGDIWRVHPDMAVEVDKCIAEYNAIRAPLYPLPDTQRIGFIDEEKFITCKKDMGETFLAGKSYALTSQTVLVERGVTKPNAAGEPEDILLSGQELLLGITGEDGKEYLFIDPRHKRNDITITRVGGSLRINPDYTLQHLLDHFKIPEVPDVSQTNADLFEANKMRLEEIQDFLDEYIP